MNIFKSKDKMLIDAVCERNIAMAEKALIGGAGVNKIHLIEEGPAKHMSALMIAAYLNDIEMMGKLMEHGALIGIENDMTATAVTFAIKGGGEEALNMLIKAGGAVTWIERSEARSLKKTYKRLSVSHQRMYEVVKEVHRRCQEDATAVGAK